MCVIFGPEGDLKPENMMLTEVGHLKVIDFGTAKDMVEPDLNGPEFVGTPEFMAPEMVDSKPPATYSADLWTTGVVAYQLLCGVSPFRAQSPYFCFLRIKKADATQRFPALLHIPQSPRVSRRRARALYLSLSLSLSLFGSTTSAACRFPK